MRRVLPTLLVASLSLALSPLIQGCKRPAPTEAAKPTQETAAAAVIPAVHFAKITEKKLPPTLDVSGSLVADETSEVASQGAGVVVSVEVDVGSRVKKGDV